MWVGDRAYSDLMRELWGSPFLWNERRTYVDIARKLDVDEETVRNRVKSLKDGGFLLGWRLVPNPALLKRSSSFLYVEVQDEDSKDETVARLAAMDGVIVVANFYGRGLLVTLYDDREGNCVERIKKAGLAGEQFTTPAMNLPGLVPLKMTVTDWRIVKLLLGNAEMKPSEVASMIKVSTKTVNRRLGEMMSSRAIFVMPRVNLKKAGGISYQMILGCEEDKRAAVEDEVVKKISMLVFRATAARSDLIFGFNATNVAEGSDILKWAKKLPGVRTVKMNIVENVVHVFDWLSREVDNYAAPVESG